MKKEFTDGILYIICTKIFYCMALISLYFIALLPTTVVIVFFDLTLNTLFFYYFALVLFQLATSALLATCLKYSKDNLLRPLIDFSHYYKNNMKDTLRVFILPNIIFLASIFNLTLFYLSEKAQVRDFMTLSSITEIISILLLFFLLLVYLPAALINVKFQLTNNNLYKITLFILLSKPIYTLQVILYLFFIYFLLDIFGDSYFFIVVPLVFYIFLIRSLPILSFIERSFTAVTTDNTVTSDATEKSYD